MVGYSPLSHNDIHISLLESSLAGPPAAQARPTYAERSFRQKRRRGIGLGIGMMIALY
jgi:hypothetical protein